jgi:septum formation protein
MKLVLASASPDAQSLFKLLNLEDVVATPVIEESLYVGTDPQERTQTVALARARSIKDNYHNALVIGAETVAVYRNKIIGKPKFKMDALEILTTFSGTSHLIISGWGIYNTKTRQKFQGYSETRVTFRTLSREFLTDYVNDQPVTQWPAGYHPMNSAAIGFIDKIEGSLTGFTYGLPVEQILPILEEQKI